MTTLEFAPLRNLLEARQAELEALLRNREMIAVDLSPDLFDQIQNASEREMAISTLDRETSRLREVRAALQRIQLGTFGICLDCEEEISLKRLAAVPWTASCIVCVEAADRSRVALHDGIDDAPFNAA